MSKAKNDGVIRMYRGFHPDFWHEVMIFVIGEEMGVATAASSAPLWGSAERFGDISMWHRVDVSDEDLKAIESMTLVWERDESKQTQEGE